MAYRQMGQRIRAFRKLKGLTQHELADLLTISIGVLGAVERGTRRASPQLLEQIADKLEVDLHELLRTPADQNHHEE